MLCDVVQIVSIGCLINVSPVALIFSDKICCHRVVLHLLATSHAHNGTATTESSTVFVTIITSLNDRLNDRQLSAQRGKGGALSFSVALAESRGSYQQDTKEKGHTGNHHVGGGRGRGVKTWIFEL